MDTDNAQNIITPKALAIVSGNPVSDVPQDLYIPPDGLRIFLEAFEGPLDLLLYLIKRQDLDILELPVAKIAEQYARYIDMMQEMQLELAAEYLLMSAMLAEIKSRMLLPRPVQEETEEDPRAALVKRLLEYQRFKKASDEINIMPRQERDFTPIEIDAPGVEINKPQPEVHLKAIVIAFQDVLTRMELRGNHQIEKEPLSVRERMTIILSLTTAGESVPFNDCFTREEGRSGAIVSLLALLEMLRSGVIEVIQATPYSTIYIHAV